MLPYTDPVSSKQGYRVSDDGASYYLQDMSGEQGAGSCWAQDSRRICISRGSGAGKPAGVYMFDLTTGVMTLLVAVDNFRAYPVWGLGEEVYYMQFSGGQVSVKAVNATTLAIRTVFSVASNGERQKIGVNVDETLISAQIQPTGGGAYKTIIGHQNGSGILANWGIGGPNSSDGSMFHPSDPDKIITSRGTGGESGEEWRVSTATKLGERNYRVSHACLWGDADGAFIYQIDSGNVVNIDTEVVEVDDGGQGQIHPRVFPTDYGLGLNARIVGDEAPFFYSDAHTPPWPRAALWVFTPNQAEGHGTHHWRAEGQEVGLHFSRSTSNGAHPHPSPSPDGKKIAFVTDKKWYPTGFTLPGPVGENIDLCVLVLEADEPEPPDPPDPPDPEPIPPLTVVIEYEVDGVPFGTVTLTPGGSVLTTKMRVK